MAPTTHALGDQAGVWLDDGAVYHARPFSPFVVDDDISMIPEVDQTWNTMDSQSPILISGLRFPRATAALEDDDTMSSYLFSLPQSDSVGAPFTHRKLACDELGPHFSPYFESPQTSPLGDVAFIHSPTVSATDIHSVPEMSSSFGGAASDSASDAAPHYCPLQGMPEEGHYPWPNASMGDGMSSTFLISSRVPFGAGAPSTDYVDPRQVQQIQPLQQPVQPVPSGIHEQFMPEASAPYPNQYRFVPHQSPEMMHASVVGRHDSTPAAMPQSPAAASDLSAQHQPTDAGCEQQTGLVSPSLPPPPPPSSSTPAALSRSSGRVPPRSGKACKVTKSKMPRHCREHPQQTFKNANEWRHHIQNHHQQPFRCIMASYGCTATFWSKNEWKRHITSQHLRLGFWRCDLEGCNAASQTKDSNEYRPKDFHRKDLFTQHFRRMHLDQADRWQPRHHAKWNGTLTATLERCYVTSRVLPRSGTCGFCGTRFEGDGGWDDFLEHVGRHYELLDESAQQPWRDDEELRDWMMGERLLRLTDQGRYELTTEGKRRRGSTRSTGAAAMDPEGDELAI